MVACRNPLVKIVAEVCRFVSDKVAEAGCFKLSEAADLQEKPDCGCGNCERPHRFLTVPRRSKPRPLQCSIFLSEAFKWPAGVFLHVTTARRLRICILRFDMKRSDWRQPNQYGRHMSQVDRILQVIPQVCSKWLPVPPQYRGLLPCFDCYAPD